MFQIYISNTDVSYIYPDDSCSIYRCFKYISQTTMFHRVFTNIPYSINRIKYISQIPMFHISIPMFHTVFTDVSNIYLKHRCFIEYLPIFHTVLTESNIYLKYRCFIYLYRCFIQYLPMFQIYISNTCIPYN
jgi:hypothetical protein